MEKNAPGGLSLQELRTALANLNAERAEERESLLVTLAELQKRQENDFVGLRKDLETVATQADQEIRADRARLIELTPAEPAETKTAAPTAAEKE